MFSLCVIVNSKQHQQLNMILENLILSAEHKMLFVALISFNDASTSITAVIKGVLTNNFDN